ncbi:hypothetical protein [Phenylobacterium deserti]|uniref:hypothetical protein n=1 Tax=Phenylobacterium deserti TaxID=1914756 RepID=UPI001403CBCD|nr:hypothetical protein [Phenylobacterium deserti]
MRRAPTTGSARRPAITPPKLSSLATMVVLSTVLWAGLLWLGALLVRLNHTA